MAFLYHSMLRIFEVQCPVIQPQSVTEYSYSIFLLEDKQNKLDILAEIHLSYLERICMYEHIYFSELHL